MHAYEQNYPRKIRSFVRRQRRFTSEEEKEYTFLFQHYGLQLENIHSFLKEASSIILDIGFGMGESLFESAQQILLQDPDSKIQCLGVEVHQPGIFQLMKRLHQHQFNHVKLICGDVLDVLEKVPDHTFSNIHVFFPDPWPKKRHHKRRLLRKDTIEIFIRKIKPEGLLEISTDVQDYAEEIFNILENQPVIKSMTIADQNYPRPLTRFKQKGLKAGHSIYDLWVQKIR